MPPIFDYAFTFIDQLSVGLINVFLARFSIIIEQTSTFLKINRFIIQYFYVVFAIAYMFFLIVIKKKKKIEINLYVKIVSLLINAVLVTYAIYLRSK